MKLLRTLELVWLSIAVISAFLAVYQTSMQGWSYDSVWFLVITLVAAMMYAIRRKQRIEKIKEEAGKKTGGLFN